LRAAKVLEASLLAQGLEPEGAAKMRHIFTDLERKYPANAAIKNSYGSFCEYRREGTGRAAMAGRGTNRPEKWSGSESSGGSKVAAGDWQQAFNWFSRAIEAEPRNALYHFNLANVAFLFRHQLEAADDKAFAIALQHFAEASRLAPADPEYLRAYAEAFYSVPDPTGMPHWQPGSAFRELTSNKDFALLNLARVHMKLGQKDQARACLAGVKGSEFAKLKARLGQRIDNEQ
jgi:tetratricopeptide (TPR) repeat protein